MGGTPPSTLIDESARILSRPPLVDFASQKVGPPTNLYLHRDDRLRVATYASTAALTVVIHFRLLLPDGRVVPLEFKVVTDATRTAKVTAFDLQEGYLLGAVAFIAGGAPFGRVFCQIELIRDIPSSGIRTLTLAAGYLTDANEIGWPNFTPLGSLQGRGLIRSIVGTTPAAGAEITETVPTGARWAVKSFTFAFTASAAIQNRIPQVSIDDGGVSFYIFGTAVAITAGQGRTITASPVSGALTDAQNNILIPMPSEIAMLAGFRIKTTTSNIQVGDQYSNVKYEVEEWIDP